MGAQQAGRRRAIEAALLEFHRAPGRHTLARREPALLFASVGEVLQLAGSRDDPGAAAGTARAARFFVRTAMLQPGADHYTLLGLPRHAEPAAIKDRYRALMRLVHPDIARSRDDDWPADAATRINQAYGVLSSTDKRRAYDEAHAPAPAQPDATAARPTAAVKPPSAPARGLGEPRRVLRRLAAGFGALGVIALGGLWAATAQNDRDSLVQRATTRTASGSLPDPVDAAANAPTTPVPPPLQPHAVFIEAVAATPASAPATVPISVSASPRAVPVALASTLAAQLDATVIDPAAPTAPPPAAPAAPTAPPPAASSEPAPASAPQPAASISAQPPAASLSMAAVQPVLTRLLQDIQSGWGDSLIAGLDRELRRTPGAQALARQLDALCDGVRPVKIARVDLRGEPRGTGFVVSGQVVLEVRDPSAPTRRLPLQAEFVERDGAPVLARIAPAS